METETETTTAPAVAEPAPAPAGASRPAWLVALAPFLEPRTWGALVYVWLAFPLGLAWFVGLTVGLATGTALVIIWIGLLLLFLTLLAAWAAEGLERRLAIVLLGARVPERRPRPAGPESLRAWLRSVFGGAALWKGLAFLALKFPLGLAGWVASVVTLAVSGALLAAPLVVLTGVGEVELGVFTPLTPLEAVPIALLGLAGFVVTLHLHRALGWVWARLAEGLLGAPAPRSAG